MKYRTKLPTATEEHVTPENPRGLYVCEALGFFYAADKYGGFTRFHTRQRAEDVVVESIAKENR